MSRGRLSIFLPSLQGGGAERVLATVASALAARGVEVTLVLGTASGPYLADLHAQVRVVDLRSASTWQALPGLVRHLREAAPDVLLAAMSHANVVASAAHRLAGSRARLVLSERVHLSSLFGDRPGPRLRLTRSLMRLTYPRADAVLAVSDGVAQDIPRHIVLPAQRVVTVYNPVVDARLHEQAAALPPHPWLRDRGAPVLLAAGRLVGQKGFDTLLDAFALLRRARPARLLILGDGPLRAALLAQAQALGVGADVALPGFEPQLFAAMRAAALFVLSSRYEGLPGVLIQAMACGCRVVSTDCPSGPREVLQDGRWGRLVPVDDPAALARALAAALDDPAPPMATQRAADFSVERAVQRYAEVLGLAPEAPSPASRQASNMSSGHSR